MSQGVGETFEIGETARAIGVPVRRLEGWVERGVLHPSARAQGAGSRRRFRWGNLIQGAILVELQHFFGKDLRPGTIGHLLTKDWKAGGLEELFGLPESGEPAPGQDLILLFTREGGRTELHAGSADRMAELARSKPVVLAVNFAVIQQRLRETLRR